MILISSLVLSMIWLVRPVCKYDYLGWDLSVRPSLVGVTLRAEQLLYILTIIMVKIYKRLDMYAVYDIKEISM